MSKPLAGKRFFEAMGRSEQSRGIPSTLRGKGHWPDWARNAYVRGYHQNAPWKNK